MSGRRRAQAPTAAPPPRADGTSSNASEKKRPVSPNREEGHSPARHRPTHDLRAGERCPFILLQIDLEKEIFMWIRNLSASPKPDRLRTRARSGRPAPPRRRPEGAPRVIEALEGR